MRSSPNPAKLVPERKNEREEGDDNERWSWRFGGDPVVAARWLTEVGGRDGYVTWKKEKEEEEEKEGGAKC